MSDNILFCTLQIPAFAGMTDSVSLERHSRAGGNLNNVY